MSLNAKIKAAQQAIAAKKEELSQLVNKAADGEEVAAEVIDTLTKSIEADEAQVASMEKAEQVLLNKAAPAFVKNKAASEYSYEKQMLVALKAKAEGMTQLQAATELYGEDSGTVAVTKAATAEARTDVAAWAGNLVADAHQGFLDTLRAEALLPKIASRGGVTLSFDKTNNVIIPTFLGTPTLSAAFIGEGKSIPVKKTAFGTKTVSQFKMGVITVATSEILRKSTPAIEPILREAMVKDTAAALDAHVFSTTAAVPNVSPAGLLVGAGTNAVTAANAGAPTLAEILQALKVAINGMTAANRNLGNVVAIMSPATKLGLSLVSNSLGAYPLAAELASGRLMGLDVVTSQVAPADEIVLIDASQCYFGIGSLNFSVSDSAALQMDDSPATGPNLNASLFQQDLFAIRAIMNLGYADIRGGSVHTVTAVTV